MNHSYSIDDSEWRKKLRKARIDVDKKIYLLADFIGKEVVNNATRLTNQTVPGSPVNAAGNYVPVGQRVRRRAHPGGWSDVTSTLVTSIKDKVNKKGWGAETIIEATAEYAAALDAKTGYSVLGGSEIVARNAINKYAPELFD